MPQLTEQEWKRVLPQLDNLKAERRQAAYNRLVKGMTLVKSGELYGYSRQDVRELSLRVLDKYQKLRDIPPLPPLPPGWMRVEFVVPRRHVDDARRVIEAMYPPPQAEKAEKAEKPEGKKPARSRARSSS